MPDLIAFLLARLEEDEAAAEAAHPAPWTLDIWEGSFGPMASVMMPLGNHEGAKTGLTQLARVPSMDADTATHIARHDPARVLREVAAKRRLIERYERAAAVTASEVSGFVRGQDDGYREACLDAIREDAAVFSDHPDYQPEWKVGTDV